MWNVEVCYIEIYFLWVIVEVFEWWSYLIFYVFVKYGIGKVRKNIIVECEIGWV